MKKSLFIILLTLSLTAVSFHSQAQSNWEVGLRGGDNLSIEATIPLAAAPRIHPVVYIDNFGVAGYFDWLFTLSEGPSGLKFYPGVGPEFWLENDFEFDIAGNFGSEYSFDFPLTIGVDWRPGFRVSDGFKFKSSNWGFFARFRFGEGVKFNKAN